MRIAKSFTIKAPQDEVWRFISSPEKVGMCFPGCQNVTALGDNKYKAAIKVQLGPIKTVFNIDFKETEKRPMEYSAYTSRGEENNRASRLKAESTLTLSPIDEFSTQVDYTSELSIVGRLGKFGAAMMKKKADSMGDEFVQVLRMQIEGPPEVPVAAEKAGLSGQQKMLMAALTAAIIALLAYLFTR
ncbi:MAG: SRPBCC domain-containing protein [Xanthomonadales bacterium]